MNIQNTFNSKNDHEAALNQMSCIETLCDINAIHYVAPIYK